VNLDEYDRTSDRISLRDTAPTNCHGCPLFHEGRWVGLLTEEVEAVPELKRQQIGGAVPYFARSAERGIGVGRLLAGLGAAGINCGGRRAMRFLDARRCEAERPCRIGGDASPAGDEWPPEGYEDESPRKRPEQILETPFERPRLPEIEFRGLPGEASGGVQKPSASRTSWDVMPRRASSADRGTTAQPISSETVKL